MTYRQALAVEICKQEPKVSSSLLAVSSIVPEIGEILVEIYERASVIIYTYIL